MHAGRASDRGGVKDGARRLDLVHVNDEGVFAWKRQGKIEHEDGGRLEVNDARRRLVHLHHAALFQHDLAGRTQQLHPEFVIAELGTPAAKVQHEMRPGVHGRELLHGDVSPQSQHRKLAVLVEDGVVAEEREIDARGQLTRIERIASP
jgi:hypothetical protein